MTSANGNQLPEAEVTKIYFGKLLRMATLLDAGDHDPEAIRMLDEEARAILADTQATVDLISAAVSFIAVIGTNTGIGWAGLTDMWRAMP